jgi:hypothetical protein
LRQDVENPQPTQILRSRGSVTYGDDKLAEKPTLRSPTHQARIDTRPAGQHRETLHDWRGSAAALFIAISDAVQQRLAHDVTDERVGAIALFTRLLRNPRWWLGSHGVSGGDRGTERVQLGGAGRDDAGVVCAT